MNKQVTSQSRAANALVRSCMYRSRLSTMSKVALPKTRSAKEDSAMALLQQDITRSNVYRVLAAFKDLQNGTFYQETPSDVDLPLTVDKYKQVLHFLDKHQSLSGFFRDKIRLVHPKTFPTFMLIHRLNTRYDYDQDDCILTIRRTSAVHEVFRSQITRGIVEQLHAIGK